MQLSDIPFMFQSRLRIAAVAALISSPRDFTSLLAITKSTPGNLGKQLELLEKEGYITSSKSIVNRRPNTAYTLTPAGREAFTEYVRMLERVIDEVN